jgi:hypothetical protein
MKKVNKAKFKAFKSPKRTLEKNIVGYVDG